jgi:hypothetical protein
MRVQQGKTMKYGIDYRYIAKGTNESIDNTTMTRPVDVEVDEAQFALIPNVGDYVDLPGETDFRNIPIKGKVKSRLFHYKLSYCYVTVLIEEVDEAEWKPITE